MERNLKTARDVIEMLGGTMVLARHFKVDPAAVSGWKRRNRIAAKTYVAMQDMLRRKKAKASPAIWGQS